MLIYALVGVFLILHSLVHLLYAGQSARLFELRPGMIWPDGSWLFSKLPGDGPTRLLASISLVLAAFGYAAAGVGLILSQNWWRTVLVGAVVLSSAIFGVCWDGKRHTLAEQGGIGVLINLAILGLALMV